MKFREIPPPLDDTVYICPEHGLTFTTVAEQIEHQVIVHDTQRRGGMMPWQAWVALAALQVVFFVLGYIQGRWFL